MKVDVVTSYKNSSSIDVGHDSGVVHAYSKYNVWPGYKVCAVVNTPDGIKGHVIEYSYSVPCYIGVRIHGNGPKQPKQPAFVGRPLIKFIIPNRQFSFLEGGKVGVKDGSQKVIKDYLREVEG